MSITIDLIDDNECNRKFGFISLSVMFDSLERRATTKCLDSHTPVCSHIFFESQTRFEETILHTIFYPQPNRANCLNHPCMFTSCKAPTFLTLWLVMAQLPIKLIENWNATPSAPRSHPHCRLRFSGMLFWHMSVCSRERWIRSHPEIVSVNPTSLN